MKYKPIIWGKSDEEINYCSEDKIDNQFYSSEDSDSNFVVGSDSIK